VKRKAIALLVFFPWSLLFGMLVASHGMTITKPTTNVTNTGTSDDPTKLPLAGGTMTGELRLSSANLVQIGTSTYIGTAGQIFAATMTVSQIFTSSIIAQGYLYAQGEVHTSTLSANVVSASLVQTSTISALTMSVSTLSANYVNMTTMSATLVSATEISGPLVRGNTVQADTASTHDLVIYNKVGESGLSSGIMFVSGGVEVFGAGGGRLSASTVTVSELWGEEHGSSLIKLGNSQVLLNTTTGPFVDAGLVIDRPGRAYTMGTPSQGPVLLFGGTYTLCSAGLLCVTPNQLTGLCSCPAGFTTQSLIAITVEPGCAGTLSAQSCWAR
jgi:uncharacterized membrane protein YciS (DUF1049 family)